MYFKLQIVISVKWVYNCLNHYRKSSVTKCYSYGSLNLIVILPAKPTTEHHYSAKLRACPQPTLSNLRFLPQV